MSYVVKFSRGTASIDLTTGRYSADFIPPRGQGVYTFEVRVLGASMAEIQRSKKDLETFVGDYGDRANPLRLEWKPDNNAGAEPVWGQFGATKKAEIINAYVDWWDDYQVTVYRPQGARLLVTCTLGAVEGARQLLANAKGGIVEDWIGTTDGTSRGIIIPEADATNGNKSLNPIFGHGTYNTGWTAGTGITETKNSDPNFVLWGLNSAKLTASSATVADNLYTENINPGNTNKHTHTIYAKLPNSGTVSSTQVVLYFNDAAQTTTYTAMGNGWYRLGCANFDGVNAATCDCGVQVKNNYTVYITGHQVEERAYATAFFYGDMLGGAWASTPHESKSTRAVSCLSLPTADIFNYASGSIRIIWRADRANTTYADDAYLLYLSADFNLYFEDTADQWSYKLVDSTGVIDDTFVAGDIVVIHLTWSPSGSSLYVNGISTDADYKTFALPTYLYIGSNATPAAHIGGTVMGLDIYNHVITDAEALADYTNISQLIADGQPVDPIPYIWSASADGVVQNADADTNNNWAVVGGIQGDQPADVEANLAIGSNDIYISNLDFDYKNFIQPEFLSYFSSSVDEISINTADTTLVTISVDNDEFEMIKGKYISLMLRCDEDATGNNLVWRTGVNPGAAYYYTPYEASVWIASASDDLSIDLTPGIALPSDEFMFNYLGINRSLDVRATGYRTASGALTIRLQTAQIMPYPLLRLTNISGTAAAGILYIKDHAYEIDGSSNLYYNYLRQGDLLQFIPGKYNMLISYVGGEAAVSTADATLTYSSVYYTPRWGTM